MDDENLNAIMIHPDSFKRHGWSGVGYAWECWSYLMRDKKYSYKLPNAFWLELNGNR